MHFDYYIEPCQFCITRAKNGADISECGWCGSGEDTHYRSSHEHPGNIVKIPADGYGYPYHDSPHPERKYYKDGRHILEMDGQAPADLGHTSSSSALPNSFPATFGDVLGLGLAWGSIMAPSAIVGYITYLIRRDVAVPVLASVLTAVACISVIGGLIERNK